MEITLIGLCGKAGSGKDFIGNILCDKYGFKRFAFADPLKDHCRKEHGWDGKKDNKGRKLLQEEGTEKHRSINPNVWLDRLTHEIELAFGDGHRKFVITDTRFPNELYYTKELGISARITGRGGLDSKNSQHSSENALDNESFCYEINNSKDVSMEELLIQIEEMIGIATNEY